MNAYIFAAITIALCILVWTAFAYTLRAPHRALWPPRNFSNKDRLITWSITIGAIGAAYLSARESWNAWGLPDWIRFYIGFPLVFVFSSVSSFAIMQLGLDNSMGAKGALKTTGLFARSRNPTYLANIIMCFGFVLLAASTPALLSAGALALLYWRAASMEETWLRRTYGEAADTYISSVPRWL